MRARIRIHMTVVLAIILCATGSAAWPGVILQGFYIDVPSGGGKPWWWDHLATKSHEYAGAGFTAVWIPCPLKGATGGYSSGYDPYDDYDLGSKNQNWTLPTHFGTREQLTRMVAMMRANGIEVYVDNVLNHRNGDPGDDRYHFQYVDAYGNWPGGRFEKFPTDFHPNVPNDPNTPAYWLPTSLYGGDASFENGYSFGPDIAHINGARDANNQNIGDKLKDAGDWLTKALDCQGYRLDYVKGISVDFLKSYLNHGAMNGRFAVGEYYDGNLTKVRYWISAMGSRSSAFDFPLRFMLKDMCLGNGSFNMASLDHAGLAGVEPFRAVTFVENHDTDRNDPVSKNKMLAYAYILTSEGYPCVYYKDYVPAPEGYGLKAAIDKLIWIHEKIAYGTTQERWKDGDVFAFDRSGGDGHPPLLVGMNDHPTSERTVQVYTRFGPGVTLQDYTGHKPDLVTDSQGRVNLTIPSNAIGSGYVAYSVKGITGGFERTAQSVTQEWAGAKDLDVRPADTTGHNPARIWAVAGRKITAELWYDIKDWTDETGIVLTLTDSNGVVLGTRTMTKAGPQGLVFDPVPTTTGWHTFRIQGVNTPATNAAPNYWLKVNYTAPPFFPVVPPNALKIAGGLASDNGALSQYNGGPVDLAAAVRLWRTFNGF